jgi:predicted ferric reductase
VTTVLDRPRVSDLTGEIPVPVIRRAAPSTRAQAVAWTALHALLAAAPLALCATAVRPGRGFLVDLSVALGFLALSVMGLQFALAARFSRATAPFGIDAVLRYHKQMSALSVLAAFGHPALLFLADDRYLVLLDVVDAPLRAQFAWLSVLALGLLMVTSIWRRALRIPYQVWHVLHSLLGVTIVLAGLVHAFLVGNWMSAPWVRIGWIVYAAAFLWLAVWVRLVKPLQLWRRPWRVVELWPEPGGAVTVGLEPAHRHGGRPWSFTAGQFAWILPGRVPFTPTYHPFSISSSALRPRVEFTIKQVGDFTRSIRRLRVGDTVYVDGPHGSFTLDRHPGVGYVLLATGVGVTPVPQHVGHAGRPGRPASGVAVPRQPQRGPDHRHPPARAAEGPAGPAGGARDQPGVRGLAGRARPHRRRAAVPPPAAARALAAVLRLLPRGDGAGGPRLARRAGRARGPSAQRAVRDGLTCAPTDRPRRPGWSAACCWPSACSGPCCRPDRPGARGAVTMATIPSPGPSAPRPRRTRWRPSVPPR